MKHILNFFCLIIPFVYYQCGPQEYQISPMPQNVITSFKVKITKPDGSVVKDKVLSFCSIDSVTQIGTGETASFIFWGEDFVVTDTNEFNLYIFGHGVRNKAQVSESYMSGTVGIGCELKDSKGNLTWFNADDGLCDIYEYERTPEKGITRVKVDFTKVRLIGGFDRDTFYVEGYAHYELR